MGGDSVTRTNVCQEINSHAISEEPLWGAGSGAAMRCIQDEYPMRHCDYCRKIASLTMSAVSSTFRAHSNMHSEKSAISLSLKGCLSNQRLARNRCQVRNSVRPMHLFGHNVDHDC